MIWNLNPVSFAPYGIILSEKRTKAAEKCSERIYLQLSDGDAPVYCSAEECWLSACSGMTVLSVSTDNETYQHFYLDRPLKLRNGIYFSLAPYQTPSAGAEIIAAAAPKQVGTRSRDSNLALRHALRISNIFTFFYQEREQGFLFPGESHPMPEMTYVDQGSLHSVVDGVDTLLEKGDLAIYGPGQWHMQHADIGIAPRFVTVSFDVAGSDLTPLLNRRIRAPQRAMQLLQQMLRELEHPDPYSDDMIFSLLGQLLLTLLREAESPAAGKLKASNSVHSENAIIRQAQQYISVHIHEKLSVPLVARMADVSPSYLTALFHKHLQISPGEYIRRTKLQESKQMIREGDLNFTEIAAALNYATVHHFSRQFKEKFGITPSEYAKSVR